MYRYEDRFDGVLLVHEFSVESDKAKIMDGLVPYFGVPVLAHMLLFSPQPGMILGRFTYNLNELPIFFKYALTHNYYLMDSVSTCASQIQTDY